MPNTPITTRRVFTILLSASIAVITLSSCSKPEVAVPVVRPVQTTVVGLTPETPFRRFPGEVQASDSAEISFRVAGRINEFPATQGVNVETGTLLGRLEPETFQARVDSAMTRFTTARDEMGRRQQLFSRGVISRSELDGFRERFEVAEAALREAQRDLDDTRLLAPFPGRIARTLVDNFQNVQAKQPILILQNSKLLEVDIQVPESAMALVAAGITAQSAASILEAKVEFPAIPGQVFPLYLESFSTEATASARTFLVTFNLLPPDDRNILPGMTCTVLLRAAPGEAEDQPVSSVFEVPVNAVGTAAGKSVIWRLDPKAMTVSSLTVELVGPTGDGMQVRSDSLQPGDEVITTGVRFLSEGMTVRRMPAPNR
jgi:RND family efflux transporter MFP subunit